MSPKHLLLISAALITLAASAQEKKRTQRDVIDDKRIYLFLDEHNKTVKYFLSKDGIDGNTKLSKNDVFSMKRSNSCNIFFKWMNPLKYRIAFKDTVYISPTDIVVNDFIKTYLGVLGAAGTSTGTKSLGGVVSVATTKAANATTGANIITDKTPFESKELNLLLLQLLSAKLETGDAKVINDLLEKLRNIEKEQIKDNAGLIKKDFNNLMDITDYRKVKETVTGIDTKITNNYEDNLTKADEQQKALNTYKLEISNKPMEAFAIITVKDYVKLVQAKIALDKQLIQKLRDVLEIMNASVSGIENENKQGYFHVKTIEFNDDQNFETAFTVSKYELNNEKYEVLKKEDLTAGRIIFEKFDPVKVSVSTGIFYANFTLNGFGVAQGSSGFTVTEDNIKSSTAIPAAFLNLRFDMGSRDFLPILQFGIDPTKKRPFLLLGGGFAIPSSKFAITGGPIWTWNQSLTKLTVGQSVVSTTDLEKDIKYEFDSIPKGWYLGFQFNF